MVKKYLTGICQIYAYCLLPNHFHLLLKIKEIVDLPEDYQKEIKKIHQPFSNLFNAYTKAINKKYNRTGSLFQEHLHRIKIDTEEYLRELILYIHLNPEKHGVNDDFRNYSYSSFKAYVTDKPSLLMRAEGIEYFENMDNFKFVHDKRKIKLEILKEIEGVDY
ncbi:MAG: transposase [Bacteroidales bacterium]|nr:transposase [Bacteroidales bacterium]